MRGKHNRQPVRKSVNGNADSVGICDHVVTNGWDMASDMVKNLKYPYTLSAARRRMSCIFANFSKPLTQLWTSGGSRQDFISALLFQKDTKQQCCSPVQRCPLCVSAGFSPISPLVQWALKAFSGEICHMKVYPNVKN